MIRRKYFRGGKRRGVALVVILASLVIVSIVLAAFLTQATLNRQISFSSAGQARAENIAFCGLDTIVGDLRSEMAAGSASVSTVSGVTLYRPASNSTAVPARAGDQAFPNLVKKSLYGVKGWPATAPYAALPSIPNRASSESTTNVSANGRFIALKRWNGPLLLDASFTNTFTPPDWILVTRRGAATNADALPSVQVLASDAPANLDHVIGRFAYTIYNEGGLLDATVAGFPNGLGADFGSRRGLLPQVDISTIPGVSDANALVEWRNKTTASSAAAYTNRVFGNTDGFSTVAPGDRTFVSRQDLIRYVRDHPDQISTEALPFLGTFTRELNGPSYTPATSRPKTLANEGYRKSIPAEQDDVFNPSLIETRVTKEFVRASDGTTAKVGEPLIKNRFALSRLAWLKSDGPASEDVDPIAVFFGLTWNQAGKFWAYRGGNSSIKRLSDIAEEGREPDFFELLQAGITIGSLGKMAGDGNSTVSDIDGNTFYQIMQIGANLIDQYDEDSYPTQISFGAETLSGVESLPYLTRVVEMAYRQPDTSVPSGYSYQVSLWYQPEVWNPHAQAQNVGSGPNRFRYRVTGAARAFVGGFGGGNAPATLGDKTVFNGSSGIEFLRNGTYTFSEPTLLSPEIGATVTGARDRVTVGAETQIGIHVGDVTAKDKWLHGPPNPYYFTSARAQPDPYITHELQYFGPGGWVTYDRIRNVTGGATQTPSAAVPGEQFFRQPLRKAFMVRSDPRSDRFGVGVSSDGPPIFPKTPLNQTVRPDAGVGWMAWNFGSPSGWDLSAYSGSPAIYSGLLSDNKQAASRYRDPDGVQRMADGAYTTGTLPNGYPLAPANFPSRPFLLNRAFRSVGEMGYASRGMPWKHLDFFTTASGDAPLLDLFCLNKHQASSLPAGRLDPNTRQRPVLEAVFAGALRTEDSSDVIAKSEAAVLAGSLLGVTTNAANSLGPLQNRTDLITRWLGNPSIFPATSADTIIKRRREAAVRALADIANTRTWNLLIDIIAQSGRYVPDSQKFRVEGERRYWLHVALDRYTGRVVAQYLEPVYE